MTLKQAFTMWACSPRNTALAAKSREAVQRVLMKKYNEVDLEQFTPAFAERIFTQSSEAHEMKVKAASILVYVLQWGGDHGHCKRPTFDYTIAGSEKKEPVTIDPHMTRGEYANDPVASLQRQKMAEEEEKDPLEGIDFDDKQQVTDALMEQSARIMNDKPKEETDMEQKKPRGKQPKPVAQIDPKTMEVVKVWPSRCAAESGLKAHNLDRVIASMGISAGFHWCDASEADTFAERLKAKDGGKAQTPKKPTPKPKSEAKPKPSVATPERNAEPVKDITIFSNDELIAEIKRRGWKGNLTMTINVEL